MIIVWYLLQYTKKMLIVLITLRVIWTLKKLTIVNKSQNILARDDKRNQTLQPNQQNLLRVMLLLMKTRLRKCWTMKVTAANPILMHFFLSNFCIHPIIVYIILVYFSFLWFWYDQQLLLWYFMM